MCASLKLRGKGGAAVAGGAEGDPLLRRGRIGALREVGGQELPHAAQPLRVCRLSGHRVHSIFSRAASTIARIAAGFTEESIEQRFARKNLSLPPSLLPSRPCSLRNGAVRRFTIVLSIPPMTQPRIFGLTSESDGPFGPRSPQLKTCAGRPG